MRDKIRYSEIFYSFQGEAELAGKPTVWIRFFGCNLECNGFGQEHPTQPETHVLPYKDFDISTVAKLEDLPVWHQGCDSSYSWSARYKKLVHDDTVESICDKLTELMKDPTNPTGLFRHPVTGQDTQLAFTGGEPMLNQEAMMAILEEFDRRDNAVQTVTVETNATKPLKSELAEFIDQFPGRWHWAMSPKLHTVSGEVDAVKPEIIFEYLQPNSSAILKFVVTGTEDCWHELRTHLDGISNYMYEHDADNDLAVRWMPDVWVMPVGATKDQQQTQTVADIALEGMRRGYNIATRNHCYVFGNIIGK
jgi:6-pyruvoyltetrahydropterin 2'-reductase